MPFECDVVVREIGDDTWELVEPLVYKGNTDHFVVPASSRPTSRACPARSSGCSRSTGATRSRRSCTTSCATSRRRVGSIATTPTASSGARCASSACRSCGDGSCGPRSRSRRASVDSAQRQLRRGFWSWAFAAARADRDSRVAVLLRPALVVTLWNAIFWLFEAVGVRRPQAVQQEAREQAPDDVAAVALPVLHGLIARAHDAEPVDLAVGRRGSTPAGRRGRCRRRCVTRNR